MDPSEASSVHPRVISAAEYDGSLAGYVFCPQTNTFMHPSLLRHDAARNHVIHAL